MRPFYTCTVFYTNLHAKDTQHPHFLLLPILIFPNQK
jgi:hypothetical protein